jgi:ubiquinone/menaquinone biosynthesis C-methylase UbiE
MQMHRFEKLVVNSAIWSWLLRRRYLPQLFRLVESSAAHHALELGCGQGLTTEEILEHFPKLHLMAVDYDPEQVARARQRLARFGERVAVRQGDATALDFPIAHFDAVFACNLFHHIREYRRALAQVARVLKPGGKLYVMDLDRRFFNPLFRRLFPPEVLLSYEEFLNDLKHIGLDAESAVSSRWAFFVRASKFDLHP